MRSANDGLRSTSRGHRFACEKTRIYISFVFTFISATSDSSRQRAIKLLFTTGVSQLTDQRRIKWKICAQVSWKQASKHASRFAETLVISLFVYKYQSSASPLDDAAARRPRGRKRSAKYFCLACRDRINLGWAKWSEQRKNISMCRYATAFRRERAWSWNATEREFRAHIRFVDSQRSKYLVYKTHNCENLIIESIVHWYSSWHAYRLRSDSIRFREENRPTDETHINKLTKKEEVARVTEVPLRFLTAENAWHAGRERFDARLRHTNNIIQPRSEWNKRMISFMTLFDRFQLPFFFFLSTRIFIYYTF